MKKEILKKTFSANLQNVWIFAFFVNLYGILVVSGQKREIWYTRYIPLAPPPPCPPIPGLSIDRWYFTQGQILSFSRPYGTSLGEIMLRNF